MASTLAQSPILIVLWLVWSLLLGVSLVLSSGNPERRLPTWGKIASSAMLAAAAWVGAISGRPTPVIGLFVALGMTMGLVGDMAMASLLRLRQPVLGGIGAFGLGHVFYCTALLLLAFRAGLTAPQPLAGALGVWLAVGAIGWYFAVRRDSKPTVLHWAALPYALLLASTAGLSSGLALQRPSLIPLALGGALFLTSDLILAARVFGRFDLTQADRLIWATYGPAQMLIVYSLVPIVL
ncbi:MAG: lysoplasmalogenase family protein [Anaerolineae bacterium]